MFIQSEADSKHGRDIFCRLYFPYKAFKGSREKERRKEKKRERNINKKRKIDRCIDRKRRRKSGARSKLALVTYEYWQVSLMYIHIYSKQLK